MDHTPSNPRRPGTAYLMALAVGVAALAQIQVRGLAPMDGWALYLAAMLLFARAADSDAIIRAIPRAELILPGTVKRKRVVLGTGLALAFLAGALGLLFFSTGLHDDLGWLLHMFSLVTLAATAIAGRSPQPAPTPRAPLRVYGLLASIVVTGFAARFVGNDVMPPGVWFDEARIGNAAHDILNDSTYRPVYIASIERPAHQAYPPAVAFALFGTSPSALRLPSALIGTLGIIAAYLLFSRVFEQGAAPGLIAAAIMASMRYDLTLSRMSLDTNTVAPCMMLTLYFLHRAMTFRSTADFIMAGAVAGFGLAFYLPIRLFVILLSVLVIALFAHSAWRERSWIAVSRWLPGVTAMGMAALVSIAPVIQYAMRNPQIFFDRNNSASIFSDTDQPDVLLGLQTNVLKYGGMFNVTGDLNGHHNWPGEPMLDPRSGVLFLLGIAVAARSWRRPANTIALFLFAGMLQAAIWSASFEAPYALRTAGVIPSLVFFMTSAILAIARVLGARQAPRHVGVRVAIVLIGIPVVIALFNLDIYFNKQAKDPAVWAAYSPEETWIGQEMARLAPSHDVILTWRYWKSPTVRFFAPDVRPVLQWSVADHLPLPESAKPPVVLFLDPSLQETWGEARRLYPTATFRMLAPPAGGPPAAYEVVIEH